MKNRLRKICNLSLCLSFFWIFGTYCSEGGGRQDCSRETSQDKKITENLQTACLADPQNPDYCRLYLIQAVYKPHCW
ncbi:hypothetical protein CH371_05020 [Leptospira wolffii]|uniref:Uncharacterized protein n=1 Tax=Leptospira wolffii TaxID=409998 RepID=A0A2M9ZGA5_9LEPT|nr:hypothetical protein [Leptospira wolffii]PJZ67396.1 hypothetical protein CH371_05020 [Leptospira wolffii]